MACASPLLTDWSAEKLQQGYSRYPQHYDDVFNDVNSHLAENNFAAKLDLAALVAWKHVRNAPWMRALLNQPEEEVRAATSAAMSRGLNDGQRIAALGPIPGFGNGGAFTSVLLSAWDPSQFSVYDRFVDRNRCLIVTNACKCDWSSLPTYWDHIRLIGHEMRESTGRVWTPRQVDMAIFNLQA